MSAQELKDEIDAHSGRFEFLKQTLTLGLAGLAGIAAIFTDSTKIPSDPVIVVATLSIGVALLALVGFSLWGMSAYANLLKATAANAAAAPDADVLRFRSSVIFYARRVFECILVIAVAFVIYAGLQVARRDDHHITSVESIAISRKAMSATGCGAQFYGITRAGAVYRAAFHSDTCQREFIVTVSAGDGSVAIESKK